MNRTIRPTLSRFTVAAVSFWCLVLFGNLAGWNLAWATPPAANTVISAQATASYLDGNGTSQIATSNTVQTIVQQVGAFTLTAGTGFANAAGTATTGSAKSGGAGATINVPYTITNTGNGTDSFVVSVADLANLGNSFTKIDVFTDQADGNGLPDNTTSLLTASGNTATAALSIPAGATYRFVVVYTIPGTAGASWVGKGRITATAATSTIGYTSLAQVVDDTVSVVTGAAFGVTSSLNAPAVAAAPSTPVVTLNNGWGATPSSGPRGTATVYTINYVNNGAAAGVLYLKDVLPAGLSYVAHSAVWSSNPGVALTETSAGGASNNTGIDFIVTSGTIEAVIPAIAVGASGTLSFKVQVTGSAAIGTSQTSSSATYSLVNCGATPTSVVTVTNAAAGTGCAPSTLSTTASNVFTVLPTYGVQINGLDVTAGLGNNATSDTVTQPQVVPGSSVKFTVPVQNIGNASDTFKLSVNATGSGTIAAANQFPAGSAFSWFAADGATPLLNTAGGTGIDTGPVGAGATLNVVLQVSIPAGTTVSATANLEAIAVATSVGDVTKLDGTKVVVTKVIGGLVDLTATAAGTIADIGPGNSTVLQTISVTAGGAGNSTSASASAAGNAVYDLYVRNGDAITLTFDLQSSQTATFPGNLLAGWGVKYYSDAGLTTQITQVAAVASGAQAHVYAVVTPAAASPTGNGQDVYFRVLSTTNATSGGVVSDYLHDQINVAAASARSFTLSASNNGQVSPGGSVTFAHIVANTGTLACGATTGHLNITTAFDSTAQAAGWTTSMYVDNGTTVGSIDGSDTLITNGQLASLAANQTTPILVRVFAPSGAVVNSAGTVTVTVSDPDPAPNCGTQLVADVATVTSGQIAVSKLQVADPTCAGTATPVSSAALSAKPGECVIYKVIATNNGTGPATNVSVNGVIPSYTTYSPAQPSMQCASTGLTGTAVAFTQATATVACGSATNALAPAGTVTLRYAVKVNN